MHFKKHVQNLNALAVKLWVGT